MAKSDQQPKTESCLTEGKPVDLWYFRTERQLRSVLREKREPQTGPASSLSNPASKELDADGDGVNNSASETDLAATGKAKEGLPGSKSVASAEGNARNEGGPGSPCRTKYEGQAGREAQRQEVPSGIPGVGSAHSIQQQGKSLEAGEGADRTTQLAQATSPVRMTEQDWQTFLRAIAEKAHSDKRCGLAKGS